ncbi:MAG: hypothetical protein K2X77_20080 [Candidatus Obscuribacterales bacterium]|nr:hypothetical protein [Candidatus Obscuribacterales bacterium]
MSEKTGRAGIESKDTLPESKASSHELAQFKSPQYADLLNQDSGSLQNWVSSNVWRPIANTLVVDTHNAVTSTVNDISKAFGGSAVLEDWKKYDVPVAKNNSDWLAQNVSTGIAMVIPYGIAAIASKGALSPLANRFSSESIASKVLASNSAALITGATIYDGLKKPGENQTRLGNALGAAVGFSIFEGGTYLARGSNGWTLALSRAFTGGLGAGAQLSVSDIVATGAAPDKERLYQAAIQGAILNPILGKGLDAISPQSRIATLRSDSAPAKPSPIESAINRAVRQDSVETPPLKFIETKKATEVTGLPVEGGFKNYADYQSRGLRYPLVETNIFETGHGARIVFPKADSNYGRLTLEQTSEVLHAMPDKTLIRKLEVSDLAHADQAWFRQVRNEPNFTIAAQSFPDGSVHLFRPNQIGAYDKVIHEWGHLFEQKSAKASKVFDKVDSVEKFTSGSNSHIEGKTEIWPVLTESLLARDNVLASATALANPVRSMIWSKAFHEHLASLKPNERSAMHDTFLKRAEMIRALSSKRAFEALNASQAADTAAIREFLSNPN